MFDTLLEIFLDLWLSFSWRFVLPVAVVLLTGLGMSFWLGWSALGVGLLVFFLICAVITGFVWHYAAKPFDN